MSDELPTRAAVRFLRVFANDRRAEFPAVAVLQDAASAPAIYPSRLRRIDVELDLPRALLRISFPVADDRTLGDAVAHLQRLDLWRPVELDAAKTQLLATTAQQSAFPETWQTLGHEIVAADAEYLAARYPQTRADWGGTVIWEGESVQTPMPTRMAAGSEKGPTLFYTVGGPAPEAGNVVVGFNVNRWRNVEPLGVYSVAAGITPIQHSAGTFLQAANKIRDPVELLHLVDVVRADHHRKYPPGRGSGGGPATGVS